MTPRHFHSLRLAAGMIALAALLNAATPSTPGDILNAELFTVEKGLPSNQVFCTFQDRHGFLWIGAVPGLARFDGRAWECFRSERANHSGPSSLNVYDICEDRRGNLWLATPLGLNRFDPRHRRFRYFGFDTDGPPGGNQVECLCVRILSRRPETLWIGTAGNGLFSMDLRRNVIRRWPSGEGTADSGPGRFVFCLLEDRRGRLWLASEKGVGRYDPIQGSFILYRLPIPLRQGRILEITGMYESPGQPDVFWISTMGAGLLRFDTLAHRWTVYSRRTGDDLPSDDVMMATDWPHGRGSLLINCAAGFCRLDTRRGVFMPVTLVADGETVSKSGGYMYARRTSPGVLWITSNYQGLFKIVCREANPFVFHDSPDPDIPNVEDISEDAQGRIWMICRTTSNRFSVWRYDPASDAYTRFLSPREGDIPFGKALEMALTGDGACWLGTNLGLARIDPRTGQWRLFPDPADIPGLSMVFNISEAPSGMIWLGTRLGVVALEPGSGSYRRFDHRPDDPLNLFSDWINDLVVDRSGTVWFGTPNGLGRYEPGLDRFRYYPGGGSDPGGPSDRRITVIFQDRRERLWAGTGNGLNRITLAGDAVSFQHLTLPGGEANNTIWCLADDLQGNLWIGTSKGLNCLPAGGGHFLFFDHSDGLPAPLFNFRSALSARDGRLWFSGWPGFISFKPQELFDRWPEVPTALTAVQLDGKPVQVGPDAPLAEFPPYVRHLTVPASAGTVGFYWAALDYVRPERVQFAWRLTGGDGRWRENGFDNCLVLSGLTPGQHTLQVRVANHNGRWNPVWTELAITVLSPWWATRTFALAATALLMLSVLAVLQGLHTYKSKLTRSLAEVPVDRVPDLGKYDVSPREMEVLRLVLRGRSNREIEDALFISASTVKAHLGSLYRKLGVRSRLQLINFIAGRVGRPK